MRSYNIRNTCKQKPKIAAIHGKRFITSLLISSFKETKQKIFLLNIFLDNGSNYRITFDWVKKLFPISISRLIKTQWLNQPIGVSVTDWQTYYNELKWNDALSAPKNKISKNLINIGTIYT